MSENLTQDPVTTDGGHDDVVHADGAAGAPELDDTAATNTALTDTAATDTAATDTADSDPDESDTPDTSDTADLDARDLEGAAPVAAGSGTTELTDTDGDPNGDTEFVEDASGHSDIDGPRPAPRSRRGQLEREGEVAADFLETLLDICDLDGDIDVDIEGDRAAVSIVDSEDGRVPRRLIGQSGQVLDALQELTRLAVQSATGERSRLMLDVGGHRAERRATLVTLAEQAIDEVRSTGERKPLTPMTAFERKVVHDEVLAAGLLSESEGSEPRRYVVIIPA